MKTRSWALRQPARERANRGARTLPPAGPTLWHGSIEDLHEGNAKTLCSTAGSSSRMKSSGWKVPDRRRVVLLAPPLPALAIVCPREEWCVLSLPKPLRRSSGHVSAMSGAVAADVAVQLLKRAAR